MRAPFFVFIFLLATVFSVDAQTGGGMFPGKLGNIKSFFARFSPDGKKIAYISGKFPQTAIYIANADGSNQVKIAP